MSNFNITVIPAGNGMFTVYITIEGTSRKCEFCGSLPEVGDFIRVATMQQIAIGAAGL